MLRTQAAHAPPAAAHYSIVPHAQHRVNYGSSCRPFWSFRGPRLGGGNRGNGLAFWLGGIALGLPTCCGGDRSACRGRIRNRQPGGDSCRIALDANEAVAVVNDMLGLATDRGLLHRIEALHSAQQRNLPQVVRVVDLNADDGHPER